MFAASTDMGNFQTRRVSSCDAAHCFTEEVSSLFFDPAEEHVVSVTYPVHGDVVDSKATVLGESQSQSEV